MAGFAAVQDAFHVIAILVGYRGDDRWRDGVEVPDVMRNVLEVADIFPGVEVNSDKTVGVEVVTRTERAVEVGRRVADNEIDAPGFQIGSTLPTASAPSIALQPCRTAWHRYSPSS